MLDVLGSKKLTVNVIMNITVHFLYYSIRQLVRDLLFNSLSRPTCMTECYWLLSTSVNLINCRLLGAEYSTENGIGTCYNSEVLVSLTDKWYSTGNYGSAANEWFYLFRYCTSLDWWFFPAIYSITRSYYIIIFLLYYYKFIVFVLPARHGALAHKIIATISD